MPKLGIEGTTTAIVKVDDRCIRWDALLTEIILCFACDQPEELPLQLEVRREGSFMIMILSIVQAGFLIERETNIILYIYTMKPRSNSYRKFLCSVRSVS